MTLDNIYWIDLPSYSDTRGVLTAIESEQDIPFAIQRIFYMHHIVADRAAHAHPDTDQVIIGMAGSCQIQVSDGEKQQTYELKNPLRGLYVPRMIFIELTDFTPDAICLVLANTHYQNKTVIRSKAEYRQRLQEI